MRYNNPITVTLEEIKEKGYIKIGTILSIDYYFNTIPGDKDVLMYYIVLPDETIPWMFPQEVSIRELDLCIKAKSILIKD